MFYQPPEGAHDFLVRSVEDITRSVLVLRDHRVLLDAELADLYGVATKALLQAVKRNSARFPADFMMQLTAAEWVALRSQFVTSKTALYHQVLRVIRQALAVPSRFDVAKRNTKDPPRRKTQWVRAAAHDRSVPV
jgi:hypothetical protein